MIFCLCNIVLQANDELLHTKYRLFTSVGRPTSSMFLVLTLVIHASFTSVGRPTPSMFLVLTLAVPARVNHNHQTQMISLSMSLSGVYFWSCNHIWTFVLEVFASPYEMEEWVCESQLPALVSRSAFWLSTTPVCTGIHLRDTFRL